jgi:hypothetical protein
LQPATAPVRAPRPGDDLVPDEIPRKGSEKAPMIRHPDDPDVLVKYRRASKFGERIEDVFCLDRRNDRLVVAGLVRFPELADEAAAVLYPGGEETADWGAHLADGAVLGELCRVRDAAIERTGGNLRAALGTEVHGYIERDLRGEDLAFLGPQMHACVQAARQLLAGFEVHAVELFVVTDRWQTGGTLDYLLSPRVPLQPPYGPPILPGERLVGDAKTGARVEHLGIGLQLTQYPNGVPYRHDAGRGEWPDGVAPRTDWALILHVPLDAPQDAGLIWVDLTVGAELSDVAVRVHEARDAAKSMFRPVELRSSVETEPRGSVEAAREAAFARLAADREREARLQRSASLLRDIRSAPSVEALRVLDATCRDVWDEAVHSPAADLRWAELTAVSP